MVFNDTTTKLGILQNCERYTKLGETGITGNSSRLAEFTAYVNEINRNVWHVIFINYGGWQYDDANQGGLPAAVDTLTANQTSYALPSTALTVRGVEIKDESGVWYPLVPLTEEMIRDHQAMGEFLKTASTPRFYQLVGQSVRVFPASDFTQASSFKVFFDRGSVAFASGNTTTSPGFASEYHEVLSIGASLKWLKVNQPNDPTTLLLDKDFKVFMGDPERNMKGTIAHFYSTRFQQMFPPRIKTADIIREYC